MLRPRKGGQDAILAARSASRATNATTGPAKSAGGTTTTANGVSTAAGTQIHRRWMCRSPGLSHDHRARRLSGVHCTVVTLRGPGRLLTWRGEGRESRRTTGRVSLSSSTSPWPTCLTRKAHVRAAPWCSPMSASVCQRASPTPRQEGRWDTGAHAEWPTPRSFSAPCQTRSQANSMS